MSTLEVASGGVAGLVVKATLVLCLALAVAWLGRRRSARTLHLLWTTTFVVLLALPVASLLGPSWPVPILPARDAQAGMPSLERTVERASDAGMPRDMPGAPISAESLQQATRQMNGSGASPVESGSPQPATSSLPSPSTLSAIAFLILGSGLRCGARVSGRGQPPFPEAGSRGGSHEQTWLAAAGSLDPAASGHAAGRANPVERKRDYTDDGGAVAVRDSTPVLGRRLDG